MKNFLFTTLVITAVCTQTQAQNDTLKMNQLQVIGSHNSYKQAIEPDLYKVLQAKDSSGSLKALQYEHIGITQQLNKGLRNLEIDIYADSKGGKFAHPKGLDIAQSKTIYDPKKLMAKPGFKILHIPDIDFRTSCLTFKICLEELKKWSDAHPNHEPVFITLEPKDGDLNYFGTKPEDFTPALFDQVDQIIKKELGLKKLITPDNVRGKYATLEEAVLNKNWPSLKDSRGKFLFILDNDGAKRAMYIANHPSLKKRLIFVNANPGTPEAATLFRNNPKDTSIPDLVTKGYLIRTRADEGTKQARTNDYSNFEEAKKSGAQIITTDYYMPSSFFKSTYQIKFDNGTYIQNNPLTAPK